MKKFIDFATAMLAIMLVMAQTVQVPAQAPLAGEVAAYRGGGSVQAIGNGGINWSGGTIFAEGVGIDDGSMATSSMQQRLFASRAAMNDAYRNLAEVVEGVKVDAESVVRDLAVERDVIRTQVNAFVRGARKVKEEFSEENGEISCIVTLEAPISGTGGFANVILPYVKPQLIDNTKLTAIQIFAEPATKQLTVAETFEDYVEPDYTPESDSGSDVTPEETPEPFLKPKPKPGPPAMISGVVIDTSNTHYARTIFPRVVSIEDDRTVFDISVAENWKAQGAFTPYEEQVENGKLHPRVATTPIIIRAEKIDGITVYVSKADADKILAANNEHHILVDGKILFVVEE